MDTFEIQDTQQVGMRGSGKVIKGFDTIVMAGDRGAARLVKDINKAFLEIQGVPLLCHVLSALERSHYVSRIFIVGPKEKIEEAIRKGASTLTWQNPIIVLDQWNTLVENAWNTFLATLDEIPGKGSYPEEVLRDRYADKVALVVGADIPLVTPYEVDEFVEGCDLNKYDYLVGMTPEEALRPYYPREGRPGIRLTYFPFRNSLERQNNLHMIRFFKVINKEYVETMYRHRYQRNWLNIVRLALMILRMPEVKLGMILSFMLLHLARVFESLHLHWLRRLLSFFLEKTKLEHAISRLLRARFGSVVTQYGGAALDVDNEEHFKIIEANFELWKRFQGELHQKRSKAALSASKGEYLRRSG